MALSYPEMYRGIPVPTYPEAKAPVDISEVTLTQGVPVSLDRTRDNVGPPIFVLPGEKPLSVGMLRLADIVGPERWDALSLLTKSDMTSEETAYVRTLRATSVLDERPISEWRKGDWRISRHLTDGAFVMAETGYGRGGMRDAQVGFAQSLDHFIRGFPEGERDMKELFGAIFELGTSRDWGKNPNLAREVANAYWDVGKQVLESWTVQLQPQALAEAA